MKLVYCADCGELKPHKAKGLCQSCYDHARYLENYEKIKARKQVYYEHHCKNNPVYQAERAAYHRRYYQKNRERIRAQQSIYRQNHREVLKINNRRYYAEHRDQLQLYSRNYRKMHREERSVFERRKYENDSEYRARKLAYNRRYYQENTDRFFASNARRRAKEHEVPNLLTNDEAAQILSHPCFYCGETKEITRDHFVPITRGGGTTRANIVAACRSCNSRKRTKLPESFLIQLELLRV